MLFEVPYFVDIYSGKKQFLHAAHLLKDALNLKKEQSPVLKVADMEDHVQRLQESEVCVFHFHTKKTGG